MSAGYIYTHNYENGKDEHSVFAKISFGTDTKTSPSDTQFALNTKYSFKELSEGENWTNRLSFSFSVDGTTSPVRKQKETSREPHFTDVSQNDMKTTTSGNSLTFKPMKSSSSFPSHIPYFGIEMSNNERMIYKLFGIKKNPK